MRRGAVLSNGCLSPRPEFVNGSVCCEQLDDRSVTLIVHEEPCLMSKTEGRRSVNRGSRFFGQRVGVCASNQQYLDALNVVTHDSEQKRRGAVIVRLVQRRTVCDEGTELVWVTDCLVQAAGH